LRRRFGRVQWNQIIHWQNSTILTSEFHREENIPLFAKLLEFYKYDEKQKYFAQFQSLSEAFEQLAPLSVGARASAEGGGAGGADGGATLAMSNETQLFAQSQRIREVEI
jgi:hypothetical protein